MRLEGSLDAFGLPDVLQLLVSTSKTGTLRLRRLTPTATSGQVHVDGGRIAGARSDDARDALARRLVAAGLIDRAALTAAVEAVESSSAPSVAEALLAAGAVASDAYEPIARAQATDAIFDLLRWAEGEFVFEVADPSAEPGDAITWDTNELVLEAQRRLNAWDTVASRLPALDAPLRLVAQPGDEVVLGSDEWTIVRLIDGARTIEDLVTLIGKGEWETATTLSALVERGLVVASDGGLERELAASAMLARVEGAPAPPAEPPAAARMPVQRVETPPVPDAPAATVEAIRPAAVVFETLPPTAPDSSDRPAQAPTPVSAHVSAAANAPAPVVEPTPIGEVVGTVVTKPLPEQAIEVGTGEDADAGVSRALLLRLIAGVRSL